MSQPTFSWNSETNSLPSPLRTVSFHNGLGCTDKLRILRKRSHKLGSKLYLLKYESINVQRMGKTTNSMIAQSGQKHGLWLGVSIRTRYDGNISWIVESCLWDSMYKDNLFIRMKTLCWYMINIFKMWCNLYDRHEYMDHQIRLVF